MGNHLKPLDFWELSATLVALGNRGVTSEHLARIRKQGGKFADLLAEFIRTGGWARPEPVMTVLDIKAILADQAEFLAAEFDFELDTTKLVLPTRRAGLDRLIVVAQGITAQRVFERHGADQRRKYTEDSLDSELESEERTAKDGSYAIWVRNVVAADEQNMRKSAKRIASEGILTETLTERLIHGLKYFRETGKHLDPDTSTHCTGSRLRGSRVPIVSFRNFGYGVDVDYCDPGHYDEWLRAREVVAAPKAAA